MRNYNRDPVHICNAIEFFCEAHDITLNRLKSGESAQEKNLYKGLVRELNFKGFGWDEISNALGIPPSTVKWIVE